MGPKPKVSLYKIFNYVMHVLSTGSILQYKRILKTFPVSNGKDTEIWPWDRLGIKNTSRYTVSYDDHHERLMCS